MLRNPQKKTRKENASDPSNVASELRSKERVPKEFLDGLGVAVAVKNPVRISVVVVTVTLPVPPALFAEDVGVAAGSLQSEDAAYRTPLMIVPSLLIMELF